VFNILRTSYLHDLLTIQNSLQISLSFNSVTFPCSSHIKKVFGFAGSMAVGFMKHKFLSGSEKAYDNRVIHILLYSQLNPFRTAFDLFFFIMVILTNVIIRRFALWVFVFW